MIFDEYLGKITINFKNRMNMDVEVPFVLFSSKSIPNVTDKEFLIFIRANNEAKLEISILEIKTLSIEMRSSLPGVRPCRVNIGKELKTKKRFNIFE